MPFVLKRLNTFSSIAFVSTLVLVGIVYGLTLAPSVQQIDSGELAAVQSTLGIAHPTGYPLFTLAGHLVSRLPLGIPKILQLNLLVALWCILAVSFFFITTRQWLSRFQAPEEPSSSTLAATCAGLFLAFSATFWVQATSVEVYSLHILSLIHI